MTDGLSPLSTIAESAGRVALSHHFGSGAANGASHNHYHGDELNEHEDEPRYSRLDGFIELAAEREVRQRVAGEVEEASGGKWAYLTPGVRFTSASGWSASAAVAVPVSQNSRLSPGQPLDVLGTRSWVPQLDRAMNLANRRGHQRIDRDMMPAFSDALPTRPLSFADLRWHLGRAFRYGLVSGVGLAVDIALFLLLVRGGVDPFAANVISSGIVLTFVYLRSVRRVFRYDGHFIVPLFAAYLFYHVCGTLLVSGVISAMVRAGIAPAIAKVGILPVTFATNYLFMSWLTRKRERWAPALYTRSGAKAAA